MLTIRKNSETVRFTDSRPATFADLLGQQEADTTVRCADGVEFQMHKIALSAQSKWFQKKLYTGEEEKLQASTIIVDFIASDVFQLVRDFFYNGSISVPATHVEVMKKALDMLEVAFFIAP